MRCHLGLGEYSAGVCSTCTTAFDAIAWNSGFAVAAGAAAKERISAGRLGLSRTQRRQQRYDHTSDFLAQLGLSAEQVLGPRPIDEDADEPSRHDLTSMATVV